MGGKASNPNPKDFSHSFPNRNQDSVFFDIYSFPSPEELMSYIITNQIDFNPQYLTNPQLTYKYISDKEQTLIVGVYLADMTYCLISEQPSKGLEFLNVINEIAEKQSLIPFIDHSLKDRFLDNFGNIDTLKSISNEIHNLTLDYLLETERMNSYILISTSSIIESLYLLLNSYDSIEANNIFNQRIAEQNALIKNIDEMLTQHKNSPDLMALRSDIMPIINAYSIIISSNNETTIRYDNELIVLGSSTETKVDIDRINHLKLELNKLRQKWIKY